LVLAVLGRREQALAAQTQCLAPLRLLAVAVVQLMGQMVLMADQAVAELQQPNPTLLGETETPRLLLHPKEITVAEVMLPKVVAGVVALRL
jgi:hypothetical protein